MRRLGGLGAALAAALLASAADAQTVRYGTPSGCSGQAQSGQPTLFYDGSRLVLPNATCTVTAGRGGQVQAQCDSPVGKTTETLTVIALPTSVQLFSEAGVRLAAMPVCP